MRICQTELNTCKQVVSNLEVLKSDITNLLSNSSISAILPSSKVGKVGGDWWILVPWVSLVVVIELKRLTWVFPWDHVMENS
jgi:hypothetical protein